MGNPKPWGEMTVDERLETLRDDMQFHRHQSAAMAEALDEIRRRTEEIERRLEELLFD
jgi:hypothetical protein